MKEKDLELVFETLINTPEGNLEDLDGLSRDRQDIIVPSCVLFNTLFDEVDATEFIFSRKGLREGVIMQVLEQEYTLPLIKIMCSKIRCVTWRVIIT